jgi:hypothetical protein
MTPDHITRLCCYMARQEARTRRATITNAEFAHFGNPDAVRRFALYEELIEAEDEAAKLTIWRLTGKGKSVARNAPPHIAAWRLAPRRVAA